MATAGPSSRGSGDPARDPKVAKLERQLNLVSYLLSARAPVPFSDMRAQVVGYDDEASPDAIEKRFDRDKADLKAIGVVIEYKADDPSGQQGYVIDKQGYFLPEISLEPEDAMLVAVLQRALGGLRGVWIAALCTHLAVAIAYVVWFRRGTWAASGGLR